MKKFLAVVLATAFSAIALLAMSGNAQTYAKVGNGVTGNLANETGLAYSKTYDLDTAALSADRLSVAVYYGSTTFAAKTFSDGAQSTGSFTIVSTTALSGVTIKLGSLTFTAGTDFAVANSSAGASSQTAANFVTAAQASGLLKTMGLDVVRGAGESAIVYATSTFNGSQKNFTFASSNQAKISTVSMTGGIDMAFALSGYNFAIPSHGFTTGLPVLYSSGGAVIGGLSGETTYYAIRVDADNIQLATTSARAQSGLYLTVTSSTTQVSSHTATLTPLALAGSPAFNWQVSNDDSTYFTHPSTGTSLVTEDATSAWDVGAFNYRYLRLNVTGPTAGGIRLQAVIHGKQVVPSNR